MAQNMHMKHSFLAGGGQNSPPSRESSQVQIRIPQTSQFFLVRFAEGTSLRALSKISFFAGGASQPLSKNSYRCEGLQHSILQIAKSPLDSLTSLIYPLPSHLIRPHYPLMFCPFSTPIGLGSFELLSLSRSHQFRRIPDLAPRAPRSGYTLCVSRRAVVTGSCRIGSKQNTLLMRLFVTPRTKFRNSIPGINEKTGISTTLEARARCP
ncbi:uncharacterized protein TNCV_4561721 [Trichonephila clavipes]|nr:uncharacterized protein TNCV_4561721 [Trichonephila clavipes]